MMSVRKLVISVLEVLSVTMGLFDFWPLLQKKREKKYLHRVSFDQNIII